MRRPWPRQLKRKIYLGLPFSFRGWIHDHHGGDLGGGHRNGAEQQLRAYVWSPAGVQERKRLGLALAFEPSSATPLPTTQHLLFLLEQVHQLGPSIQIYELIGPVLIPRTPRNILSFNVCVCGGGRTVGEFWSVQGFHRKATGFSFPAPVPTVDTLSCLALLS